MQKKRRKLLPVPDRQREVRVNLCFVQWQIDLLTPLAKAQDRRLGAMLKRDILSKYPQLKTTTAAAAPGAAPRAATPGIPKAGGKTTEKKGIQ